MKRLHLRWWFSVIVLVLFLGSSNTSTFAQTATPSVSETSEGSDSFQFYPANSGFGTYFSPTVDAGAETQLTVLVANTGSNSQDLRTYAVNAFTALGGGFEAADFGTPPNEVTSWLDFPEKVITLEPGKGIEQTFTVSVPKGTSPGQYITALAAEQGSSNPVPGSATFTQRLRFVVPVFITVPGETKSGFEVRDITTTIDSGTIIIAVDLDNIGDVRVRPNGDIRLLDADGNLAVSIPIEMESIYAHDNTTLTAGSTANIPPGDYTVEVNFSDKETNTTASGASDPIHIDINATPVAATITISAATIEPSPNADAVQFAVVDATISNTAEPIDAQLSLLSYRDGEQVERFPISQSLSLPQGETPITTRYIPIDGWSTGEWTFELLLETVDPSTGAAVVIESQPIEGSITIP